MNQPTARIQIVVTSAILPALDQAYRAGDILLADGTVAGERPSRLLTVGEAVTLVIALDALEELAGAAEDQGAFDLADTLAAWLRAA